MIDDVSSADVPISAYWSSPYDCTVCKKFSGYLEFRSEYEPDIEPWEEVILMGCTKGSRFSNNFLLLCNQFEFNPEVDSLVYRDTTYPRRFRMFNRVKKLVMKGLDGIIYDLVDRVYSLDLRGYSMPVCIQRVHLQTGISREVIFREVMGMIETGLLVRESIEGAMYLRPPSPITKIGDIGKVKVIV